MVIGQTDLISRIILGRFDVPARHVGVGRADLTDDAHGFGGVGVGAFISFRVSEMHAYDVLWLRSLVGL